MAGIYVDVVGVKFVKHIYIDFVDLKLSGIACNMP